MKKLLILLTVFSISLSLAGAQTPSNTPDAEEAELDRLNKEVVDLYKDGKFDEALKTAQKVLPLSVKVNGAESRSVAVMYFNMGAIYQARRQPSEALEHFGKAYLIYRNKFPGDKIRMFEAARKIALIHYYERRDNKEAARWFLDALKLSEALYGENAIDTAYCLGYLGMIYQNLNEDVEAESYFWRAMEAAEKVYGDNDPAYEKYSDAYACFRHSNTNSKVREIIDSRQPSGKRTAEVLSGKVINGSAISLKVPKYPPYVYEIGGRVWVKVTIDEQGNVIKAHAYCGPAVFWNITEQAALESKFSPTLLSGIPVKITGLIVYNFEARPKPSRD